MFLQAQEEVCSILQEKEYVFRRWIKVEQEQIRQKHFLETNTAIPRETSTKTLAETKAQALFCFAFKHLYWSIIAFQWCVSFCCITKCISHTYTYIPITPPSCVSLPPSLSHPSRWSQSTQLISLCYAAASGFVLLLLFF